MSGYRMCGRNVWIHMCVGNLVLIYTCKTLKFQGVFTDAVALAVIVYLLCYSCRSSSVHVGIKKSKRREESH